MIKNIKELKDALEEKINTCSKVFITPHIGPDCDAIGSAIALNIICNKLGKEAFIIIDDKREKMDNSVKMIIDELPDSINIITSIDALKFLDDDSLLVVVDTNKKDLIPFTYVEAFKNIVVIDHHKPGITSIETDAAYIDINASSACEIMYQLMILFSIKLDHTKTLEEHHMPSNICNYLLSGIILDTSKLTKNVTARSMDVVAKLLKKGANMNYANDLFLDDFESDMRVSNLVSKTVWKMFNIGIAMNNEYPDTIYFKEDLAKVADWLIKYKATDASFALGYIEPGIVYISARSKGGVDVGEIMSQLGGGGNECSGAARIVSNDIKSLRLKLDDVIRPGYKLK